MDWSKAHLPTTLLGRVRLGAWLFACLPVFGQLFHLNADRSDGLRVLSAAAIFTLLLLLATTALRRRPPLLEAPLLGASLVLAGSGLTDPWLCPALAFSCLVSQSLYGSRRMALARLLFVLPAVPLAIALMPATAQDLPWKSGQILVQVPLVLVVVQVIMRTLLTSIVGAEASASRDRVLTRAVSQLLNQTDRAAVLGIAREAATSICAGVPGGGALLLVIAGGQPTLFGVVGFSPDLAGASLPRNCLAPIAGNALQSCEVIVDPEPLDSLVGGHRHWRALRLGTPDVERVTILGSTAPIEDDVFDAMRTLGTAWSLALASCIAHAELTHRAHHDDLTQLANRTLLFEMVNQAVDDLHAGRCGSVSLLVIDLDDFKQVNDVHGHAAGDELLTALSQRLVNLADPGAVPARLGGDEFVILLTDHSGDEVAVLADQLRLRLREPVQLAGTSVSVSASIGVASATSNLSGVDLMRCADIAMYAAKARGKNTVEYFSATKYGEIADVRLLEEHLAEAVRRGEIHPHYQPIVDLTTGQCVGVEALARWQHPTLGAIPPDTFIPAAEQTGHIIALGAHILDVACHQVAGWARGGTTGILELAVNVAPRQLARADFVSTVTKTLLDSGLPAHLLTLEITESHLVSDPDIHSRLEALAELGVRIAIDDFGTGYTSLTTLRSLPIHQLKIDRSYLPTGDTSSGAEMFELIVSMGRVLSLQIVAEGAETSNQVDLLCASGVDLVQGYFFSPPMPAEDFPRWVNTRRPWPRLPGPAAEPAANPVV